MEKIGFGPRLGAALIDVVIMVVTISVVGIVLGVGSFGLGATGVAAGFSAGGVIVALVPLLYTATEIFLAATPGKKLLKLSITNQDGTPAAKSALVSRWVMKSSGSLLSFVAALTTVQLFSTLGVVAGLIVTVGCFFTLGAAKLALHDRLAKTAVYRTA